MIKKNEASRRAWRTLLPDEDPEFLRYLSRLGLAIGAEALVDQAVPYNDSLMLRLGDQLIPLDRKVAAEIRVEPVDLSPGHPAAPS